MNRIGRVLLLISLVIGPLCVGSYFDQWRWPLLMTATLAIIVLLTVPCEKGQSRSTHWWLMALLIFPILQGLWMWYNAWGVFSPDTQSILILENPPAAELPGTADRAEAWDRLSYIIPCLGLIWVTRKLVLSLPGSIRLIANIIFWTGTAVALLGLIQRWMGAEGIYWSDDLTYSYRQLFFGTYRSPGIATSLLNMALAMGLSVSISPKRHDTEKPQTSLRLIFSIFRLAGIIILITAIVSAGSKAGIFFGFLTILLWFIFNRKAIGRAFHQSSELFAGNRRMERNLFAGLTLLIAILAALSFAGTVSERWESAHESDYGTITERGASYAVQLEMIQDKEWGALGFGPGSFYPLFPYFSKGTDLHGTQVYAHNDYLQTLIEWGWLGTSVFTVLIGGGFFLLTREITFHKDQHRRSHVIYMRGCLIAMITMLLHATLDFPFQIESIAVTFSVILGIAWAAPALRVENKVES